MQIKLFTVSVGDNVTIDEMNKFLRNNKVLDVQSHLVSDSSQAYWCFCVKYIETSNLLNQNKAKIDYRRILDNETFEKFSKLREIRKKVAADNEVLAFMVFTDEELVALAKLAVITKKNMLTIKGIGEKKVEKFAKYFINEKEES